MSTQKKKTKVFGRITPKEIPFSLDNSEAEKDLNFQKALREAARVASLTPEEWEAEKLADALAEEAAKKQKHLEFIKNHRDFIVLLRKVMVVIPESEWPSLTASEREFQKRKEALIQKLVCGPMPCPLDTCARPYRHSAQVIQSCIERPSIFCNPNYLLGFLQREVMINELKNSLDQDVINLQRADVRIDKLTEELQVSRETAKKVVSEEALESNNSLSFSGFDPMMHYKLKEYINRQTIWGIRSFFQKERSSLIEEPTREVDWALHEQMVAAKLERLQNICWYSEEAKALAPLPAPDVTGMSKQDAEEAFESWEADTYNRKRKLAQLLNLDLEPKYSCSKIPVEPHVCWWDTPQYQQSRSSFPPLFSTFWFVYNFLTKNSTSPEELEAHNSFFPKNICEPDPALVQKQLEARREKVPKHLITPELQQQWDKELEEALKQFDFRRQQAIEEAKKWERLDHKLARAIQKLHKKNPEFFKNLPDTSTPLVRRQKGQGLTGVLNRKNTNVLGVFNRPFLQTTDLEPVYAPPQHWGSFQKKLFNDFIQRTTRYNKLVGEEMLNVLWEEYQLARLRGDEFFYGKPLKRWIFPRFEKPGQFIQDEDEFFRRQRRIEKIKALAKENRRKLQTLLIAKKEK